MTGRGGIEQLEYCMWCRDVQVILVGSGVAFLKCSRGPQYSATNKHGKKKHEETVVCFDARRMFMRVQRMCSHYGALTLGLLCPSQCIDVPM